MADEAESEAPQSELLRQKEGDWEPQLQAAAQLLSPSCRATKDKVVRSLRYFIVTVVFQKSVTESNNLNRALVLPNSHLPLHPDPLPPQKPNQ
jgi:hypothetical protein